MRLAEEDVTRHVRHAALGLWRSPGFSLAVILTLALGIGGNTAVFSVVDQLRLPPLPYPDGDQLVMVEESTGGRNPHADVSPANWLDWQRESRTFRRFAAWQPRTFTLTGAGEPRRVNAQLVSSEFFPPLGVAPLLAARSPMRTTARMAHASPCSATSPGRSRWVEIGAQSAARSSSTIARTRSSA